MKIQSFIKLANLFKNYGFSLFLVGGSVRDYLMYNDFQDFDCATDAKIEEIIKLLPYKRIFKDVSSGTFIFDEYEVDITTLRIEDNYIDHRHPSKIKFTNSIEEDSYRRDFTINALYMDASLNIYDFHNGLKDLKKKELKFIKDPLISIKEDPLRIIRAIRFMTTFNFSLNKSTRIILKNNAYLLKEIRYQKIISELNKFKIDDKSINQILKNYNIDKYIPLNFKEKKYPRFEIIKNINNEKILIENLNLIQKKHNSGLIIEIRNNSINDFYYNNLSFSIIDKNNKILNDCLSLVFKVVGLDNYLFNEKKDNILIVSLLNEDINKFFNCDYDNHIIYDITLLNDENKRKVLNLKQYIFIIFDIHYIKNLMDNQNLIIALPLFIDVEPSLSINFEKVRNNGNLFIYYTDEDKDNSKNVFDLLNINKNSKKEIRKYCYEALFSKID